MNNYQDQISSVDSVITQEVITGDILLEQPTDTAPTIENPATEEIKEAQTTPRSNEQTRPEQAQIVRRNSTDTQDAAIQVKTVSPSEAEGDSLTGSGGGVSQSISLFTRSDKTFFIKSGEIWGKTSTEIPSEKLQFNLRNDETNHLNWTLVVCVISVLLILFLKTFYQKFVTKVMNTMVNFQLADTILREKNSITKRAFLIMNLNFILIIGLFTLLFVRMYDIQYFKESWKDYLLILAIISSVMILRYVIFNIVGWIFEWIPAVSSNLHNNYLINKNLGLILLPVVLIGIYTTPFYSRIIIFTGLITIIIVSVFRLIRGFQVLLKNGILLFYAILYLCTLELLPLVLGSKLIILLR